MENLYPEAYDKTLKLATVARFGLCERKRLSVDVFNAALDSQVADIIRDPQLAHEKIVTFMHGEPQKVLGDSIRFMKQNPDTVILSFASAIKKIYLNQDDLAPQLVKVMVDFSRVVAMVFDKPVPEVQLDLVAYGDAFQQMLDEDTESATLDNFYPPSTDTRH